MSKKWDLVLLVTKSGSPDAFPAQTSKHMSHQVG